MIGGLKSRLRIRIASQWTINNRAIANRPIDNQRSALVNHQSAMTLFVQQLPILLLLELVDRRDVLIGGLLHVVEAAPLVVFGDLVILEKLLQSLVRVAADLPHAVASLLG